MARVEERGREKMQTNVIENKIIFKELLLSVREVRRDGK